MSKLPVGIQVYGLRDLLENTPEKFKEVMEQVKAMGYAGVELAGLYGLEPEYVRDVLQEVGLAAVSAHVPLAELMADLDKVISDYKTIGVEYIAIPYLPDEYRHNTPGYAQVIAEMRRIGEALQQNGLKLQYHNHDFEFVKLQDGTFGLDDIYTQVDETKLLVELDTCWTQVAGVDPAEYIRQYGARCEVVHLKDFVMEGDPKNLYQLIGTEVAEEEGGEGFFQFRPVGFGQMIWEPILEAALEAGSKWVIVEQDEHYGLGALEAARRSREYLRILGW